MRLFIEPTDVWLFRDGRPFDVDAGHRARTIFPPFPTVIQGMIRSAHLAFCDIRLDDYLNGKAKDLEQEIGAPGTPPPFTLRGPFLAKRTANGSVERFFPRPADTYLDENLYKILRPQSEKNTISNMPDNLALLFLAEESSLKKVEKLDNWWSQVLLEKYLSGQTVSVEELRGDSTEPLSIFERESRVGIQLESDIRRVKDGFLYEIEYVRLKEGFGIEIEVDELPEEKWPSQGLVRLGGDGRSACFTKLTAPCSLSTTDPTTEFTKLYFTTPTYFKQGWKPNSWDNFLEGTPQLIAAALEKPIAIGSIDLAKSLDRSSIHQMHRPSRRHVPAGSVYIFKDKITLKHGITAITETNNNIGFGQTISGRYL